MNVPTWNETYPCGCRFKRGPLHRRTGTARMRRELNHVRTHFIGPLAHGLLAEAVRDVADCGAEDIDPRLDYVTVQIDRELWRRVRALAGKEAS